jgi:hypothetical protein
VLFPLENDPFAPARGVAVGQETTSGGPLPAWLALAGALALLGMLGAVVWRARWRTAASRVTFTAGVVWRAGCADTACES